MASYSLVFRSVQQPHTLASVSQTVANLVNRPRVEVYAMLSLPGLVMVKGLTLHDAQARQAELLRNGCVCTLEPEPELDGDVSGAAVQQYADTEWTSTLSMMVLCAGVLAALLTWLLDGLV